MGKSIHSIFQKFNNSAKPEPFWKERTKTIIYGAGNIGKDVFRILKENGIHVSCFLDQKAKPDSYWDGVPIYPIILTTLAILVIIERMIYQNKVIFKSCTGT